ncbi:MAG: FtsX-like permease family protein [Clostridiales bacterium]|nr:FtsX-like permease family protein [Clostridiales bacterium]
MYDFRLLSTLGLRDEDVQYFSQIEGVIAEGAVTKDFIADISMDQDKDVVLKAHSITDEVNLLNIRFGKMPKAGNECVLDARFFTEDLLGAKIRIASTNGEDTQEAFRYIEYTVVGIADSVNYLNYDRGTSSLAGGSVYAFIYLPKDGFSMDYYTEILIGLKKETEVYSEEYKEFISDYEKTLEEALESRVELRYKEIVGEARQKVFDAEKEYEEAYHDYLVEKADAEEELNQALTELMDAEEEIKEQEEKLNQAEEELADGEREYIQSLKEYEESLKEFQTSKAETLAELDARQAEIDQNRTSLIIAMKQIEESGTLELYREQYETLEASLAQVEAGQIELKHGREKVDREFSVAEEQLREAKIQLDSAKEQLEKSKRDIQDGWDALEEGKLELADGFKEYEEGKEEVEEAFAEVEEELRKAKQEIDDAWKEIEDIPTAKIFVLNRDHNVGYASFENDSAIVDGIAKVLPIFFFLVAALVCLTTMTRMVDEQRTQIGTLKALGYSDGAIARKYIFYSGSAALLGCMIGYLLGTKFFPIAIWEAYGMMYEFSPIEYVFDVPLLVFSLAVSLLCSAGVTYISCKAELLQMPAQLIRPKAPKSGKRVLLERIPVLWKRISFLHKVSIRNILRYKRRFFMTVFGIAGCTALVVAAMGVGDSIRNIANDQFDTIMTYDYNISFTEALTEEEQRNLTEAYREELSETVFVATNEMEVGQRSRFKKATIVATDDPDITKVIGLYSNGKTLPYPDYSKVVINNGLAEVLDLNIGDTITIKTNEIDTVEAEISNIFDNYMSNYLFMTGDTYKALFGEEANYKNAFATTDKENLYSVSALLSNDENVATVAVIHDMRVMIENMMQSLNTIIWLVIACAGALAFVVIYNLNNINITERSREIATIKVLGFYANETRSYIFRETVILTLIGSLLGLLLGKLLHGFIMDRIKIDALSFKEQIFGTSYIVAILVTFGITFLVNLILNKKIEKVNMAESLKSVE